MKQTTPTTESIIAREHERLTEERSRLSEALECCQRRLRLDHSSERKRSPYEIRLVEERDRLTESLKNCEQQLREILSQWTN